MGPPESVCAAPVGLDSFDSGGFAAPLRCGTRSDTPGTNRVRLGHPRVQCRPRSERRLSLRATAGLNPILHLQGYRGDRRRLPLALPWPTPYAAVHKMDEREKERMARNE